MNRRNFLKKIGLLAGLFVINPMRGFEGGVVKNKDLGILEKETTIFSRLSHRYSKCKSISFKTKADYDFQIGDLVIVTDSGSIDKYYQVSNVIGMCTEIQQDKDGLYSVRVDI